MFTQQCFPANIEHNAVVSAPSEPDKKYFGMDETPEIKISEITEEIFTSKVMFTALNFLNTY